MGLKHQGLQGALDNLKQSNVSTVKMGLHFFQWRFICNDNYTFVCSKRDASYHAAHKLTDLLVIITGLRKQADMGCKMVMTIHFPFIVQLAETGKSLSLHIHEISCCCRLAFLQL